MLYFLIACLLAAPDRCVWSYDCMEPTRIAVDACVAECYADADWQTVRQECNAAERLCERDRFLACFAGPIPRAWLCEPVASDGTLWCQPHARRTCEEFDYDNDGDVDLYDYGRWLPSQWRLLR